MKKTIVVSAVLMALVFASVAFAAGGSSLLSGYGGPASLAAQSASGTSPVAKGVLELPFTGLDLLPILAGGAALMLAGAALRRSANRKS